jgi:hypothetical protein
MARGWLDHELFDNDDVYCKRVAWAWLIEHALWRPKTIAVRGTPVRLERGQVCYSLSYIAEAWGWTVSKVRSFFAALVKRHMIGITHCTGLRTARCVVTLCNYEHNRPAGGRAAQPTAHRPTRNPHK